MNIHETEAFKCFPTGNFFVLADCSDGERTKSFIRSQPMRGMCNVNNWSNWSSVFMPRGCRWWCNGGDGPNHLFKIYTAEERAKQTRSRSSGGYVVRLYIPFPGKSSKGPRRKQNKLSVAKMRHSPSLSTLVAALIMLVTGAAASASPVPMMFVFGDSFVDSGNNNYLDTTAHANHFPYGINFVQRVATGRWSDGKIVTDFLADRLGIAYPPRFLDATNFTDGANFGSAGSGILNITHIGGQVLTFTDQVNGFDMYFRRLSQMVGRTMADYVVSRSIFYINIGNNDVNDFLQDHNTTILPYGFRSTLLLQMQSKIQQLYRAGARKLVVSSAYPLGCAPMYQVSGRCNSVGVNAARYYNEGLFELLQTIQRTLRDMVIVYANAFQVMLDVHQQPLLYGFRNVTHPCCPTISRPQDRWCYMTDSYCEPASTFLFWDTAHPSDAFNRIAAGRFWNGDLRYAFPMNVQSLANR